LGVITEISLKVLPRPRAEQTLRLELPPAAAVESFNRWSALGVPISGGAWWQAAPGCGSPGQSRRCATARERIGGDSSTQPLHTPGGHCGTVSCPVQQPRRLRLSIPAAAPPLGVPGELLIDWGGALRWYADPAGDADVCAPGVPRPAVPALCWRVPRPLDASTRCHRRARRLQPPPEERFDPHGIFNRGGCSPGFDF